jgi:hypothetical protein
MFNLPLTDCGQRANHISQVIRGEAWMTDRNSAQQPHQIQELTSAIKEMANRVTAEFIQDEKKTQNFIAACAEREKARRTG